MCREHSTILITIKALKKYLKRQCVKIPFSAGVTPVQQQSVTLIYMFKIRVKYSSTDFFKVYKNE